VLPEPPSDAEKASYAWRSLPSLAAALFIAALGVSMAQVLFEVRNAGAFPEIAVIFGGYTLAYLVYQLLSLPVNYTGRSFDLAAHDALVRSWRPARMPLVDIFLPVCGEPAEVLRNTWIGVFELVTAYLGEAHAFVLDDGPDPELQSMAADFGFSYLRRPELRWHKKAGNLNYAFARTRGQHVVVFDADFRPRPDFLAETLPYLDDPAVGIVQTPQFFRTDPEQTWVERAAGPALEVFYRAVQVSRNRFSSALCVGSNAVYRRAALEPTGGFTRIPYAEDSHTGLDARYNGYRLTYVPVPLAAGICPATLDAFMRQQYRWCCGATSLVFTRHMWRVPMPLTARLPYVAGWLWNFTTALRTLILPLIPITLLALAPGEIRLRNGLLLLPAVLTGTVLYPLWHNSRYSPRIWPLSLAIGWAQVLGLWDYSRGRVMSWQPSRGPGDATRRFWWGVTTWNGGLAIAWVVLALWRIAQTGSGRFSVVAAFGVVNLLIVGRLIFPGRTAA
jgi:cellulose synthase (UDP-forming)